MGRQIITFYYRRQFARDTTFEYRTVTGRKRFWSGSLGQYVQSNNRMLLSINRNALDDYHFLSSLSNRTAFGIENYRLRIEKKNERRND